MSTTSRSIQLKLKNLRLKQFLSHLCTLIGIIITLTIADSKPKEEKQNSKSV